jgi:hypothetical protein
MGLTPRTIEVRIAELVLDGPVAAGRGALSPADDRRLRDAVERELGRLVREGGLDARIAAGNAARLDGAPLAREGHATPAALGADIARSVYAGLKR